MSRFNVFAFSFFMLVVTILTRDAFAFTVGLGVDVNDVTENIVESSASLPALMAGLSYLSGLLIAATGLIKVIEHVSAPTQTPIRTPVIRLLIGGALFALPIVTEAARNTIGIGTGGMNFSTGAGIVTSLNGLLATASSIVSLGTNLTSMMEHTIDSADNIPALIAALAYLLAILFIISALFKIRDHVEDPTRVPLKDSVIRLLTGGALLALPTVYQAMFNTMVDGGTGFGGAVYSFLLGAQFLVSTDVGIGPSAIVNAQCATAIPLSGFGLFGNSISSVICNSILGTIAIPIFLTSVAYVLGLVFGLWGIIKIRDHVSDPSRTQLNEGVTRLLAGGAFFAMPYLTVVLTSTFLPANIGVASIAGTTSGFAGDLTLGPFGIGCNINNSLDMAMACFMADVMGPMHNAVNFFCFSAGFIFIMIGISRIIKSSQEGARGPGGLGTVSTFIIGGILLSATVILRAFSATFFGSTQSSTNATLAYTSGMSFAETQAAYHVISAVLKFLIVIGIISFVRGLFIMRDVAEGKQQASTMSGITHIIGGALAVNLGPVLNAIQNTLGVTAFGVAFN